MTLRQGKRTRVDTETRKVIAESEANRRRLIELSTRLCVYVDDLRDLTVQLEQHRGDAPGG